MKSIYKLIVVLGLVAFGLIGCSKDKGGSSSTVQCDSFGRCYNVDPNNPYNPYNPYQPHQAVNSKAIILSGKIYISDGNAWRNVLVGLGTCVDHKWFSNCGDGPFSMGSNDAFLQVIFNDYTFSGANGMSPGSFTIGNSRTGQRGFKVNWRAINNNTGFDTQVATPWPATPGEPSLLRVQIMGRSTDHTVNVRVYYGNRLMGTGYLYRMNRPLTTNTAI